MQNRPHVHILPCLINNSGETDVEGHFTEKIFRSDVHSSKDKGIPGGFTLKELCGPAADLVPFNVELTEKYDHDVYVLQHGSDTTLKKKKLCNFFRGRHLRGREINLEDFNYRASIVHTSDNGHARENDLISDPKIECKQLTETADIASLTIWNLEKDISPLDINIAGYKYLMLSSAIADYDEEENYVKCYIE